MRRRALHNVSELSPYTCRPGANGVGTGYSSKGWKPETCIYVLWRDGQHIVQLPQERAVTPDMACVVLEGVVSAYRCDV